jgi:hypothetical protein
LRKAHLLVPNKRSSHPRNFIFFDTETKVVDQTDDYDIQVLRLGVAKYVRKEEGSYTEDEIIFRSPKEFCDFLLSKLRPRTKLYCFAHNLAFDFAITAIGWLLQDAGFTLQKFFFLSGESAIEFRRGHSTVVFIDSMNYFRLPLREIGRIFGLEKLEVDFNSVDDDKLEEYCRRDVEILKRCILHLVDFIKIQDLGEFRITAASQAFQAFRHRYMKHKIYLHDSPEATKLELGGYFGGRTEAFWLGRFNDEVTILDIQSMYPYVMKSNVFPVRLRAYLNHGLPYDAILDLLRSNCIMARCILETDEPAYAMRKEGKLIFPRGRFETILSSGSLRYAIEQGHLCEIREMAVYKAQAIFEDYVTAFWELRKKYKEEENAAYEALTKLMLNCLYGKFGQRAYEQKVMDEDSLIMPADEILYINPQGEEYRVQRFFGKLYAFRRLEEPGWNAFPGIAAHVTDYARMLLWKYIKLAGRENVYYVDTDSLFTNREGFERLKSYVRPGELGYFRIVSQVPWVEIRGLKDYRLPDEEKIKGISKKAIKVSDSEYIQSEFPSMLSVIREEMRGYVKILRRRKKLLRVYEKGYVDNSGQVVPFYFHSK